MVITETLGGIAPKSARLEQVCQEHSELHLKVSRESNGLGITLWMAVAVMALQHAMNTFFNTAEKI